MFEDFSLQILEEALSKWTSKAEHMLNFLNCSLQMLPVSIASNIASKLLELTDLEAPELKKNIYFTLETMFAATVLPTDFVEEFLKKLIEK
jgi:hypothetical protein